MSNGNGNNPPVAAPPPEFYQALVNRLSEPRSQSIKSIPCEIYDSKNDFDLWVVSFVDNVRAAHNLTPNDARLNQLCLNWVSTKLAVGPTRSVYDNLSDATKQDWPTLKQALSSAYKNESEEIRFLSCDDAWTRGDLSLIDYKNGLLHRLSKYQPLLKNVPGEWERTAVRRFRAGLKNPPLEAHILMSTQGQGNHTLEKAFTVATVYENTLQTIGQNRTVTPNLASMLIPQMASLSVDSVEPPQFSALTALQEKTNERISVLETAAKKHDLDISEMKAGLSEIKEGLKTVKEEIAHNKITPMYQRPAFQRVVKPLYPVSRMPLSQDSRSYYQQGARPKIVQGLTGGPRYVSQLPAPQAQPQRQASTKTNFQSTQMDKTKPSPLAFPQRPPGTMLNAMDTVQCEGSPTQFANPSLQYGTHDTGYGWTDVSYDDALSHGYDPSPEGVYVYSDMPF